MSRIAARMIRYVEEGIVPNFKVYTQVLIHAEIVLKQQ
jgi:hypothetical protein